MNHRSFPVVGLLAFCLWLCPEISLLANIPGGGTGTGQAVTLVNNGNGTVTMANGIVSIQCTTASATLTAVNYTYNNSGTLVTNQLLTGGKDGGEFYWETGGFGSGGFAYSVVANNGNYCEIDLSSTSVSNGVMDVHFSMLRGSPGFYVTAIWSHRNGDVAMGMGETRDNIYLNPEFTWNTIDANRNFQYNLGGAGGGGTGGAVPVMGAPQEVTLWTNGIAQGRYEDKYKYTADFGTERVWGWSSVNNPAAGDTGQNIGIWHILASAEYYNGGPMKPELMDAPMVNMLNGGHYYMGNDSEYGANEVWSRVQGPYFIYCNNVTNTLTKPFQTAQALYADAQAQAAAEQSAWPYYWFTNSGYAPAAQRGTVSGQFVIADAGNPNATASNLWVGVVQQPTTINGVYDFQEWMKPYQFWTKADTNGNFTIPNVIAGNNYTLWAFGPGINGTFMSQSQSGNYPVLLYSLPVTPFGVNVTGGATNSLGTITWTNASRVGATVFEIGYPDRTARKFRHGEDWWVGDVGSSPTNPMPIWTKFLEYPFDFPNGPNYVVGQSRWSTGWNFIQPVVTDQSGNYNPSTSTITFNLASAPTNGATASLYLGLCSDDAGALIVTINGVNVSIAPGLSASPISSIPSSGYFPYGYSSTYSIGYSVSDTSIREGINGAFSDERLTFAASLLQPGQNTITINMRKGGYFANHAMYDYIRLELTGYVPPPPASATAYAGNNANLVCWPVTPGATSYNIYGTTTSGANYSLVAGNVVGPVCGSGFDNATYLDTNAVNGTTYYYVVQSVNPTGTSTNSPESPGATPSASLSSSPPAAPTGLTVTSVAHQSVTLNWSPSAGANYYTIQRSTLVDSLGGASNVLNTITLDNNLTGTSYTDTSPTDGSIYSYTVTANAAGGSSGASAPAVGVPLPAPPASAPAGLTAGFVQTTNINLTWAPVSGAVGYIISRATSPSGPFGYVMSITETNYLDVNLSPSTTYYYTVEAVNSAGVSTGAAVTITAVPTAPTSLSAVPGNSQVILTWAGVPAATGYVVYAGTASNSLTAILSNYSGTSYTNTGLNNGTTYYYEVAATNAGGLGPDSPLASATPSSVITILPRSLTWKGDGSANSWDVSGTANWTTNNVPTIFNNGDTVTFDNTGSNNVPITVVGAPQPALVTFTASKNYILSGGGSISGTNAFVKAGTGSLTVNTTNLYSGGTIISNGVYLPGNINANQTCWGSGPVTLAGGTIQFNGYAGSTGTGWGGMTNPFVVPAGQSGTLQLPPRWGYSAPWTSALSGAGTLNVTVDYVRDYFSGDWSAFTGLINVTVRSGTGDFRINNSAGYANAAIYLNNGVNFYNINGNGLTIDIGELGGTSAAYIGPGSANSTNPTWRIGAKNTTNTYTGAIADAGTTSLIKIGTGTLILNGVNSGYSGSTTINGGLLLANNPGGSATGVGPVTVATGGMLGGTGIVSGTVTVNSGGALAPGNPLGTLTLSNNLTLASGSTVYAQVQHTPLTNNAATILGTLTENGTLNVANPGSSVFTAGDSFKIFTAATYNGAFSSFVLPPLNAGLVWNTNLLKLSGTLAVATYAPPTIGALTVKNGQLVVNGSGGIADWNYYVLVATNLAAPWSAIATNQFDASGNFIFTNTINANSAQFFYRLQLQ